MTDTDPDRLADELEQDADELERRGGELQDKIEQTRGDWERKRADPGVPGAVPAAGSEDDDGERAGEDTSES